MHDEGIFSLFFSRLFKYPFFLVERGGGGGRERGEARHLKKIYINLLDAN